MIQVIKCSPSEQLKKCVPKNSHSNLTWKSILLDRKNIFKLNQQFYSKRKMVHAKIIRNNLVLQYFFIR